MCEEISEARKVKKAEDMNKKPCTVKGKIKWRIDKKAWQREKEKHGRENKNFT